SVTARVFAIGGVIALANATVAVRLSDATAPGARLYLFFLNSSYWAIWTLLTPVALWLGTRVRFAAGRRVGAFVVHTASSAACAAVHLLTLSGMTIALRWWIFGAAASATLAQLRAPTRSLSEWEITMYWAIVGVAHALAFRAEAREREVRAAQLES